MKVMWTSKSNNLSEETLISALKTVTPSDEYFTAEIAIAETLYSTCVETTAADTIEYARRKKRDGFSRMVKNRQPRPTNTLTVILKKLEGKDSYLLITAFAGEMAPKEPWNCEPDSDEYHESVNFWKNHALLYNADEIAEVAAQTPMYYL